MGNTALITGASGGIGREFARCHAATGGDVVLVARSKASLTALKEELESSYGVKVMMIVADLSLDGAAEGVFAATLAAGVEVDILINNAGFGGYGHFPDRELAKEQDMIEVNVISLVTLTHLFLQPMVKRANGKLLHVASTAGLLPGPMMAVYYATKAFVVSFSQSLAQELENTGVTSTVLCPGPVATNFIQAGELEDVAIFKRAATPRSVAECGYEAMRRGRLIAFNDIKLRLALDWLLPLLPRKLVLKISQKTMEKKETLPQISPQQSGEE